MDKATTIQLMQRNPETGREEPGDETISIYALARSMTPENFTKLFDQYLNLGSKGFSEGKQVGLNLRTTHRTIQRLAIGLLIWPMVEYLLHRFVFHFSPKNPSERMKRILFLMHGVHHAQPREKSKLVMPPVVSIPLAAIFYGLFLGVVGSLLKLPTYVDGIFAGFMLGYVIYDMTHYALHHFSFKGEYFVKLRRHHMAHHFKTHNQRFGVSTWLWDDVFGTNPR